MTQERVFNALDRLLQLLWGEVHSFLPTLLIALGIFLVGLALAYTMRHFTRRLILGLDRVFGHRSLAGRMYFTSFSNASEWLSAVVFWMVILFSVTVITEVLGLKVVSTWLAGITTYLPKIIVALIIGLFGFFAGKIAAEIVNRMAASAGFLQSGVMGKLTQTGVMLVTIVIAFGQLGIDLHFLTTLIYICLAGFLISMALSFGLGSRQLVANVLASYYLRKSYQVGQTIKISEIEGKIVEILPSGVVVETKEGRTLIPCIKFVEWVSTSLRSSA